MNTDLHAKTVLGATPLLVACQTLTEKSHQIPDQPSDDITHIQLLLSLGASAQDKVIYEIIVLFIIHRITMDGAVFM
jgi:hypothetical protein